MTPHSESQDPAALGSAAGQPPTEAQAASRAQGDSQHPQLGGGLPSLSLTTTLNLAHLPDQKPEPGLYEHLLTTARDWIASLPDWKLLKTKSAPIDGQVGPQVTLHKTNKGAELWAGRISKHADRRVRGTATWQEFYEGIKVDHSHKEGEYTPDVYAAVEIGRWPVEVQGWKGVEVAVYEMYHSIPVLNDRFFTTCVITANQTDTDLIVVQLPFDVRTLPAELQQHSQRRPTDSVPIFEHKPTPSPGSYQDEKAAKGKDGASLVEGRYVSVEYISVGNEGTSDQAEVTWKMATASDAAGKLPQFVTNASLPGQIAKDVQFFLKWVDSRRTERES